jgi:hypothetical protein
MRAILNISLALLIGIFSGVHPALGQELVGLQNVTLKPGEVLWTFDIQLQEGRIVAVCNVPEGWAITAENYGEAALYKDGGGRAHGSADFGHDAPENFTRREAEQCPMPPADNRLLKH